MLFTSHALIRLKFGLRPVVVFTFGEKVDTSWQAPAGMPRGKHINGSEPAL